MTQRYKKMIALLLAAVMCMVFWGCAGEEPATEPYVPTQSGKPILPGITGQGGSNRDLTAVYVSVFGDLAILATYPVLEFNGEEPDCAIREISTGGAIRCGGAHEAEKPITRVLITGKLVPQAMNDWFRNMVHLEQIQGLEKVKTHHVKDMSHLFAGCERLSEVAVDGWDVSGVEDMTGIFEGCTALRELPAWYKPLD